MLLQSAAFYLHAKYLEASDFPMRYVLLTNLLGYGLLAVLIGSTITTWRERSRTMRTNASKAKPEPTPA